MSNSNLKFTRRRMLKTLGIGAAGFTLKDVLFTRDARADNSAPPKILIFCYFSGGWDQLMALDPRPFNYGSSDPTLFPNSSSQIDPAWDQIVDTTADVDSQGTTKAIANYIASTAGKALNGRVQLAGTNIFCGPSLYDTVLATDSSVAGSVCIIRGINMGTLTHEVGRRYFITGKFPRGLQAAGSSLPTWVAYQNGPNTGAPIPNLTVGVETYNEGLPAFASGLMVNTSGDLVNVLKPLAPSIGTPSGAINAQNMAVHDFESQNDCWETQLDGVGTVSTLRASRLNALSMVQHNLSSLFTFSNQPSTTIAAMYSQFGLNPSASSFYSDLAGAKGQALIAAQAITPQVVNGQLATVSTCVSIQLATGIDDHDSDWTKTHGSSLRAGFDAFGRLIRYLQNTDDALVPGHKLIERTQLMGFSEFARTPMVNSRGGRDHHLASSCIIAGAGIKGGQVIGGTADTDFGVLPVDLNTGSTNGGSYTMSPADVHATFLQAAGLSSTNLSNQQPQFINAILAG
jgi:hypothetical protein